MEKKEVEQGVSNLIEEHGKNKVMYAAKKLNKFIKLFNVLCRSCKQKVIKKPSTPLKEYCGACQSKARVILK